jgi:hypothetical protein
MVIGRLPEDRAASDHHGVLPGDRHFVGVEERHDPGRCALGESRTAHAHGHERGSGNTVDVLVRRDRLEHAVLVGVARRRVLDRMPSTDGSADSRPTRSTASSVLVAAGRL